MVQNNTIDDLLAKAGFKQVKDGVVQFQERKVTIQNIPSGVTAYCKKAAGERYLGFSLVLLSDNPSSAELYIFRPMGRKSSEINLRDKFPHRRGIYVNYYLQFIINRTNSIGAKNAK